MPSEDFLMSCMRCPVIVCIFCRKSCLLVACLMQIFSAGCRCLSPEFPVSFLRIFCEQFIKMWQMIRGIRKIHVCDKFDQMIGRIPHRFSRMSRLPFVDTFPQDCFCLFAVSKYSFPVPPTGRCKKQCHGEIFFSVRRRSLRIMRSIRATGPGKIVAAGSFRNIHISPHPLPETVKFRFLIQLYADHHAIGHSLRAYIMIAGILQIRHIISCLMIKTFCLRSVKYGFKGLFQSFPDCSLIITALFQYISINSSLICSCHLLVLQFLFFDATQSKSGYKVLL